jgi:hypothetical protein
VVVGYGCCVGDWYRYAKNVVQRVQPDRPIIATSGHRSIAVAYNLILDAFENYAASHDLDAVILLHDDLEITDPQAEAKFLAELDDPTVMLVGVAGGDGQHGLAWWNHNPVGHQQTDVMAIDFGPRRGDVTLLEGSILAFSPAALRQLRFDLQFPGVHGYDEIGMQAAQLGRVVVADVDTHHHSALGFKTPASGDDWLASDRLYRGKWGL